MSPTPPTKQFRLGHIRLNILATNDRAGVPSFLTNFVKLERNARGQCVESQNFRHSDLPVLRTLAERGSQWMEAQRAPPEPAHEDDATSSRLLHLLAVLEYQLRR